MFKSTSSKPEITKATLKNVFVVLEATELETVIAGVHLDQLANLFGIRSYETKKLNRLEATLEAARRKGYLELTGVNKYRPAGKYNEPNDKQPD